MLSLMNAFLLRLGTQEWCPCSFCYSTYCGGLGQSNKATKGNKRYTNWKKGFPSGSVVKNLPVNAGDPGSIPGSGKSTGEGIDYTL